MTPDRRSTDFFSVPSWAVPLLIAAATSAAIAYTTLSGKENASNHAADVAGMRRDHTADFTTLQALVREAENQRDMDHLRDSAWKADAMRILLDVQRQVKK